MEKYRSGLEKRPAFQKGAEAALEGLKVDSCPYRDGSSDREAWLAGHANPDDRPYKPQPTQPVEAHKAKGRQ